MPVKLMNDEPEYGNVALASANSIQTLSLSGGPILTLTHAIDTSPLPVGDISFQDLGVLDPQSDITPLESVMLTKMLFVATTAGGFSFRPTDHKGFAEQHGLARHFRKA